MLCRWEDSYWSRRTPSAASGCFRFGSRRFGRNQNRVTHARPAHVDYLENARTCQVLKSMLTRNSLPLHSYFHVEWSLKQLHSAKKMNKCLIRQRERGSDPFQCSHLQVLNALAFIFVFSNTSCCSHCDIPMTAGSDYADTGTQGGAFGEL